MVNNESNGVRTAVYIRPENLDKWNEIEHKSEWVNDMLSGDEPGLERKIRRIAEQVIQEERMRYS